jgi:hypothetical protein
VIPEDLRGSLLGAATTGFTGRTGGGADDFLVVFPGEVRGGVDIDFGVGLARKGEEDRRVEMDVVGESGPNDFRGEEVVREDATELATIFFSAGGVVIDIVGDVTFFGCETAPLGVSGAAFCGVRAGVIVDAEVLLAGVGGSTATGLGVIIGARSATASVSNLGEVVWALVTLVDSFFTSSELGSVVSGT